MNYSIIIAAAVAAWSPQPIGSFAGSGSLPAPWRVVRVGTKVPPTSYRQAMIDGVGAIEANADSSMALLARPIAVDISRTPILCWKWWIEAPVTKADMSAKSGDDYAARLYVAFDISDASLGFGTRLKLRLARRLFGKDVPDAALNYVWDNRNPVGTMRKSAYTDRAQLIVTETGATRARRWVNERVDIAHDYARAFPGQPGQAIQLAIASDTDNTRSRARAAFAEIHFVARGDRC